MADLLGIIEDYSPSNGAVGVPLRSPITVSFSVLMDEDSLSTNFFLAGPDTDQFVGPGVSQFSLYPDNVSQGDDFLTSPGYKGIVQGAFSFETVAGKTVMTFTPTNPMAALTLYTAYLPDATGDDATEYTGQVTFSWTTGSGSIVEMPSNVSTSILTSLNQNTSLAALTAMEVIETTPEQDSVQNDPNKLKQIEVLFNKQINASSIDSSKVTVRTYIATEHPNAAIAHNEELATVLEVQGPKLIIKI
jgi:hypothetical protein